MWLHEGLDYWAGIQPNAEFSIHDGVVLTYAEAALRVNRMAGALARDLEPGDRFALLSRNNVNLVLLYHAASKAGVVPVPLNYRLAPAELSYIINNSESSLLLAHGEYDTSVASIREELPSLRQTIAIGGTSNAHCSIEDWMTEPIKEEESYRRRCGDVLQIYTSGTTGRPKGAILSQSGLFALLYQWRMCFPFSTGERILLVAPLYHVGGTFNAFHAIGHGGSLYLFTDFDPVEVIRALDEEHIEMGYLVPAMIQACLAVEGASERRYEGLRQLSYGASPVSEGTLRKALAIWGCDFIQSYGMTEAPCVTYLTPEDHRQALAGAPQILESAGRIGPGSDVMVVDSDGVRLPPGEVGEILARGPQLMQGYWKMPEATAQALAGGWMHTGDVGMLDEAGYLFVKDRLKDMIVSGAENIYPQEIENVLREHPDVADVAVIGVPSEQWGETVKAIVVLVPAATATDQLLIEFCRPRLAGYKRPRSIDFVDELPRNPSGKVLKRVLREPYWAEHNRQVS
jgi:acyl-CoA synthetase (AMP-forming)/AMP-acid ligase II